MPLKVQLVTVGEALSLYIPPPLIDKLPLNVQFVTTGEALHSTFRHHNFLYYR